MRLTKRQLKRIIREEYTRLKRKGLIREMWGSDEDYPEELYNAICPDTAMAFWDEGEHWAMEDENNWINEEQGHRFEIIGPDKVKTHTSLGMERILTAQEAINLGPEGEEVEGDWY